MAIVGTGVDIVECLRIAQMIGGTASSSSRAVYTDAEIEYCTARKAATQHYSGRWAARKPCLKPRYRLATRHQLARHRNPQRPQGRTNG